MTRGRLVAAWWLPARGILDSLSGRSPDPLAIPCRLRSSARDLRDFCIALRAFSLQRRLTVWRGVNRIQLAEVQASPTVVHALLGYSE